MIKELDYTVYPSDVRTITVIDDKIYGGAHNYEVMHCLGFNNGETEYDDTSFTNIDFIEKLDDGTIVSGLQSEQLAYILLDRCIKLNDRFPSVYNEQMITGLRLFLAACHDRVADRMNRGVMGELKK
jgi:hypothetical protein